MRSDSVGAKQAKMATSPLVSSKLQQPVVRDAKSSSEEDDDSEEEDEEDEEEATGRVSTGRKSAVSRQPNARDLDWTAEEQQTVLKFYGLDTLFPSTWGEDHSLNPTALSETTNTQDKKEEAIRAALQEEDTSDPLKIKGKIRKPRGVIKRAGEPVSILISDKNYSPKTFLLEVHRSTDFKELEQGATRLKQSITERHETTKGLVKKHFAKFVNAKSTVDSFYKEMKGKNLISREDYGIAPFLSELDSLEKEANALYGPVLERRAKADKIRITLSILEQWKFFFNLASSLTDMIRRGRYDAAVRDYKKGKAIMQSSFWLDENAAKDVLKPTGKFGADTSNLLPKNYQSVFEKLWVEVERVVTMFRDELFKSLRIMSNPVETQERIISYLIDLDSKRDPVWCYLDTQYNWVLDNLVKVYRRYSNGMKDIIKQLNRSKEPSEEPLQPKREVMQSLDNMVSVDYLNLINTDQEDSDKLLLDEVRPSLPWTLNDVKKALMCVTSTSFEAQFGDELLVCFWKQTHKFVQDLCEVLVVHLPAFWRTCKMYMDGTQAKEHSKRANQQKRIRDGRAMMTNVFEIIQTMINYCFFLGLQNESDADDVESEEGSDYSEEFGSIEALRDPSSLAIPVLKDLSAYGSIGGLDVNGNTDSDAVWQTFQTVSNSLEKLKESTFSVHLK
ncbi:hypothetical protein HDU91_003797, partial [Kappamyces sp. JEL0680]